MRPQSQEFQSILAGEIQRFLSYKRALGCRFDVEETTLRLLDRFLVDQAIGSLDAVTSDVIDDFLTTRPRTSPRSYNHLLGTIRRLFDWLVKQGLLAISPVQAKPRRQTSRRLPFLFDQQTAKQLLNVASRLEDNSCAPLRAQVYHTIFALLYGLGLRVGEVTRLYDQDLDLDRHLLIIRQTKFYKSRLVPFGPRMADLLKNYLKARQGYQAGNANEIPLFSFLPNRPINPGTISQTFHHLIPQLRLNVLNGVSAPRLHDLRHSFAVGTLLRWYRSGIDPGSRLLQLSTFLGHVSPVSTAEYLTITHELLQEAGDRFERFASPLIGEDTP